MKRHLLSATALLLLAALAAVTAACGDAAAPTAEPSAATEADTAAETTEAPRSSGLPEMNWEGRAFTFISRDASYVSWESFDVWAESENGEPLNDAVYQRNAAVEELYNVTVAENKQPSIGTTASKLVLAGDTSFDAIVCNGQNAAQLSTSACLADLYGLPYVDLTAEWWDQNANRDFSINGRLFFTCSDLIVADKDGSWVLIFNKRLHEAYDREDPYRLIRNNKWTYETFYDMAKGVESDLDGDGKWTENDQYGIVTENYDTYAAFFYSGARVFKNDDGGYPAFVLVNERNLDAYDAYMKIVNDDCYTKGGTDKAVYMDGRGLLRGTTLLQIRHDYRDLEDDFGMLVVPKYDEAQENYAHVVSIGSSGSVVCVPVTTPDPEFTGFILEALTFASTETVKDAYLNVCFNGKYLRDEESVEMLALSLETRVYDFSIIYTDWGANWLSVLVGYGKGKEVDLASKAAAAEVAAEAAIQSLIDTYQAIG